MVGSRCVVQGCSNRTNKAAGIALHASPTDRTRDLWVRFVRTKRKNFFPQPQSRFVICSEHFEESCFTRAFDPTQRRQIKPGSLPTIWEKKESPSKKTESTRQRRMKEKERQKVRFNSQLTNCYIYVRVHMMPSNLISQIYTLFLKLQSRRYSYIIEKMCDTISNCFDQSCLFLEHYKTSKKTNYLF